MIESDKKQFAIAMAELGVAFQKPVSKETLSVYFKRLSPLTLYQVTRAIEDIIEHDDRFPVLSRLKAVAKIQKKSQPVYQDVPQIEEITVPAGAPRTREECMEAIDKMFASFGANPPEAEERR